MSKKYKTLTNKYQKEIKISLILIALVAIICAILITNNKEKLNSFIENKNNSSLHAIRFLRFVHENEKVYAILELYSSYNTSKNCTLIINYDEKNITKDVILDEREKILKIELPQIKIGKTTVFFKLNC